MRPRAVLPQKVNAGPLILGSDNGGRKCWFSLSDYRIQTQVEKNSTPIPISQSRTFSSMGPLAFKLLQS